MEITKVTYSENNKTTIGFYTDEPVEIGQYFKSTTFIDKPFVFKVVEISINAYGEDSRQLVIAKEVGYYNRTQKSGIDINRIIWSHVEIVTDDKEIKRIYEESFIVSKKG